MSRASRLPVALAAMAVLLLSCGTHDDSVTVPGKPTGTTAAVLDDPATSTVPVEPATTARSAATTAAPSSTSTATSSSSSTTTTPPPTTDPPGVDPGTLPQTRDKPAASSPTLTEHARLLWQAIVDDDPAVAMPFFFPKGAYAQVKDIPDPEDDYEHRLVAAYEEDIHALHAKLGAAPTKAAFTGITVPPTEQWIVPGVEHNKGGYWRVYGATLGYTLNGAQRFTIASMISWRGQWYVVHLNSIR